MRLIRSRINSPFKRTVPGTSSSFLFTLIEQLVPSLSSYHTVSFQTDCFLKRLDRSLQTGSEAGIHRSGIVAFRCQDEFDQVYERAGCSFFITTFLPLSCRKTGSYCLTDPALFCIYGYTGLSIHTQLQLCSFSRSCHPHPEVLSCIFSEYCRS